MNKKTLLFATVIAVSVSSCAKRAIAPYRLHLTSSQSRTINEAKKDSALAKVMLNELVKAHPELAVKDSIVKGDSVVIAARVDTVRITIPVSDKKVIQQLMNSFRERELTIIDSLKLNRSTLDPFLKLTERQVQPLVEQGQINLDTTKVVFDNGAEVKIWKFKGKQFVEKKEPRVSIPVEKTIHRTTIKPDAPCPPQKSWINYWQTWIACGVIVLAVMGWFVTAVKK